MMSLRTKPLKLLASNIIIEDVNLLRCLESDYNYDLIRSDHMKNADGIVDEVQFRASKIDWIYI